MNRRHFITAAAGAGLSVPAASAAASGNAFIEMTWLRLRTGQDNQMQRGSEFLSKGLMPALQRAGVSRMGFFGSVIAPDSPFLMALVSYPSMAAAQETGAKLRADADYQKAMDAYYSGPGLPYMRLERSAFRGFDTFPDIEMPPAGEKRPARIFEMRTYESTNMRTLARKIKMFDEGEIAIFRRCGMNPVFFGEALYGRNMPNLTYMLAFDDLAARDKGWRAFGSDPGWQKLRSMPGYSDAEIVSNISNSILRPLGFSPLR